MSPAASDHPDPIRRFRIVAMAVTDDLRQPRNAQNIRTDRWHRTTVLGRLPAAQIGTYACTRVSQALSASGRTRWPKGRSTPAVSARSRELGLARGSDDVWVDS